MGHFNKTVGFLDQAILLQADETCGFQREIAIILWSHLDASVLIFNYDAIVDPRLKDGCYKKVPWQEYMALSAADMRYSSSHEAPYYSYCPYPPELLLLTE